MLTVILIICLVTSSYATCEGNDATSCDDDNAVICKSVFGDKNPDARFETLVNKGFFISPVPIGHRRFVFIINSTLFS